MEKINIAIGTASKYKLNAIKKVLHELDVDYDSKHASAASEVSEQPHGIGETKLGSVNRAKNALAQFPEFNIGVGVEFGYEPFVENRYKMVCWATIVDSEGNTFSEQSSTLEMPQMYVEALENGDEVGVVFESLISKLPQGNASRRFNHFMLKDRVIYESVENVMLRYLFRKHY